MVKIHSALYTKFTSFWWGERGLTAFLVMLLSAFFLSNHLNSFFARLLIDFFLTLLLVSGVANISSHILPRIGAGLVAAMAIVLNLLQEFYPGKTVTAWSALFTLLFFVILTIVLLRQVFREGPVTADRVRGAIAAYIMLGITWSFIYKLIDVLIDGAFSVSASLAAMPGPSERQSTLTYFSFITLTTVGYGDITAVHPTARLFVVIEALIGQLYPATLLARLVSLEIISRQEQSSSVPKTCEKLEEKDP